MTQASLNEAAGAAAANPRARALARRIASIDPEHPPAPERLEALALGLVDALLDADEATLRPALAALRAARARAQDGGGELTGWLDALVAVAHWGLERVPEAPAVDPGTKAWDFLSALADATELGSSDLRELLETDETQVSRTGRHLLEAGLVTRSRVGRHVRWRLTPRGRVALDAVPEPAPRRGDASFWMDAIRRGFESAAGDEPGERRDVDPTRERIVEATAALHAELGIRETTWQEIAARAGVSVGTVEGFFPTLDDLVTSCGQHVMASLRLPPPERAAEIFEDAGTRGERVRRLVDTLFDVYEREGDKLERAFLERAELQVLDDSMTAAEAAIDALVAEAVGGDAGTVASVKALTGLTVWRMLQDQGASPPRAAELAAEAVERRLEWESPERALRG